MYKFDVALSYEGASEKLVHEVADYLRGDGLQVFFAPYFQKEMVSKDLKSELFQIYQNESLVKVLFVTKKYQQSQYTQIEERRALSSTRNDNRRLIIVNFLKDNLPEHLKKYVYLGGNIPTDEIADFIIERVKELKHNNAENGDYTQRNSDYKDTRIKNLNVVEHNQGAIFGDSVHIGNITINN